MKQLLAGVLLVLLIGVGAFLYRNTKERPLAVEPTPGAQKACTLEAKICPDGTSVGRTGPDCAFLACPAPNVENAALHISYAVPAGYHANPAALGSDPTLVAVYESGTSSPNALVIHSYPIPAGKTATDVILANTMHESSGMPAKSMSEFSPVLTGGKTFQSITVERFEAMVHTEYYLVRKNDVLRFEAVDRNVMNWTDPKLKVETLPAHKALLSLLTTLQAGE